MNREPVCWSCRDEERMNSKTVDEAVEAYLDSLFEPGTSVLSTLLEAGDITVRGFAREELDRTSVAEMALENTLERLDETWADPDLGGDGATKAMKEAALVFADAIIADYNVWICEPVCEEKVNALEWVRENAPRWLEEKPR